MILLATRIARNYNNVPVLVKTAYFLRNLLIVQLLLGIGAYLGKFTQSGIVLNPYIVPLGDDPCDCRCAYACNLSYFNSAVISSVDALAFDATIADIIETGFPMTPSTESDLVLDVPASRVRRRAVDYFALTKPRIVAMVLITTAAGFYLGAQGSPDYLVLLHTLIGTALTGGGTLALNQLMEREADALMVRTRTRPLPDGRLLPVDALVFGLLLTVCGIGYLGWASLWRSASSRTYRRHVSPHIYTTQTANLAVQPYRGSSRSTPSCHRLGSRTRVIGIEAWILFTIMFLWQVPHSLAIGWLYRDDFAKAKFCLFPVIDPNGKATGRQVVLNCALLFAVGFLPYLLVLQVWATASPPFFSAASFSGMGSILHALCSTRCGSAASLRVTNLSTQQFSPHSH